MCLLIENNSIEEGDEASRIPEYRIDRDKEYNCQCFERKPRLFLPADITRVDCTGQGSSVAAFLLGKLIIIVPNPPILIFGGVCVDGADP